MGNFAENVNLGKRVLPPGYYIIIIVIIIVSSSSSSSSSSTAWSRKYHDWEC